MIHAKLPVESRYISDVRCENRSAASEYTQMFMQRIKLGGAGVGSAVDGALRLATAPEETLKRRARSEEKLRS